MKNDGIADNSLMGYLYQRFQTTYTYLSYKNNIDIESIEEENFEDIDLIQKNNKRIAIQVKCFNGKTKEDITKNSGFYKVICRNSSIDKINYIENIKMLVYRFNGTEYNERVKTLFDKKNFSYISKFILLLMIKNKKIEEQNFSLTICINEENLNKLFDEKQKIIENILINKEQKHYYELFTNPEKYNVFLNKIELLVAKELKILMIDINNLIINDNDFKNYFNDDDSEIIKEIKLNLIKNTINDELNEILENKIKCLCIDKQIKFAFLTEKIKNKLMTLNEILSDKHKTINKYFEEVKNKLSISDKDNYDYFENIGEIFNNIIKMSINSDFDKKNINSDFDKKNILQNISIVINMLTNKNIDTSELRKHYAILLNMNIKTIINYIDLKKLINFQAKCLNKKENKYLNISLKTSDKLLNILFDNK